MVIDSSKKHKKKRDPSAEKKTDVSTVSQETSSLPPFPSLDRRNSSDQENSKASTVLDKSKAPSQDESVEISQSW